MKLASTKRPFRFVSPWESLASSDSESEEHPIDSDGVTSRCQLELVAHCQMRGGPGPAPGPLSKELPVAGGQGQQTASLHDGPRTAAASPGLRVGATAGHQCRTTGSRPGPGPGPGGRDLHRTSNARPGSTTGRAQKAATAGPARPWTLRSAQLQRRQAARAWQLGMHPLPIRK